MGSGLYFPLSAILFNLLIFFLFFIKKHIKTFETKLYGLLIVVNFVSIIAEIACTFASFIYTTYPIISGFIFKFYLICILTWATIFTIYIFYISCNKQHLLKIKYKLLYCFEVFYLLAIIFIFLLPIQLITENNFAVRYTTGPSVTLTYILSSIEIIIMLFCMLKNIKNVKTKKYLPLFAFLTVGSIAMTIQMCYPGMLLITYMETFITSLMYHTIENPDMALINELNIANDQAVKANAAKTDFLSSMSHEIRTPLNAIVGFSESLKEEDLSSEAKEEVDDIIDASDTLLEIVNGILDISKIEANKIEIVNTEYNFKKIFNELVALSKSRLGETKPIEFRYKMDESIPDTLYGDYARIKQIILNLLTNSIKYTNEGYIDFQVNSIINDSVCRLIISVEDTGIGIKKESINKLFTKFERLDEKNTTIEGTGLGLAITKKLVEMMNGKIVVQSMFGKGSKFTVIIDQKIIVSKEPVLTNNNTEEETIKEYPNKKILIVDDNQLNLKVAARLLKCYKCQIEEVESGFKAIDLIASNNQYDLILMDDMMPKLSGIDTLHRLKENVLFNIPVVALTANAISGMREKYLSEGFNDYLAKPIEKDELNAIINRFLS